MNMIKSMALILCFAFFCGCGFISSPSYYSISDPPAGSLELEESSVPQEENEKPSTATAKKAVNILFVVDTSYSMVKHLEKADRTFKGFVPGLSSVNWSIAITNMDYSASDLSYYNRAPLNGQVMRLELNGDILPYRFLHSHLPHREKIFLDTLKRYKQGDIASLADQGYIKGYVNPCDLPPYCQSNEREPIKSLMSAFLVNKDLFGKHFKKHAPLAVVFFTNGDSSLDGKQITDAVINGFHRHYGSESKLKVYSISIIPQDQKCFSANQADQYHFASSGYSTNINELVKHTGGGVVSICSPDYAILARMLTHTL